MTNETVLKYFRKSICKVVYLNYQGETELQGLKALKFVDNPESYKTWKADGSRDCFSGPEDHILPDGLTDLSKCYYNFPMVMSPPHFLGFENASYARRVSGLRSNPELHESRMFVEPLLGIGMKELARSQMNTYVHDLSGFPAIFNRLSGMVVPVAWVDLVSSEHFIRVYIIILYYCGLRFFISNSQSSVFHWLNCSFTTCGIWKFKYSLCFPVCKGEQKSFTHLLCSFGYFSSLPEIR